MPASARSGAARLASVLSLLSVAILGVACTGENGPSSPINTASGSGGATAGGPGGSVASGGGADGAADQPGSGGMIASGSDAGSGGAAPAGTGGAPVSPTDGGPGPAAGGPFRCSEMIGLWVMSQWWGPFEKGVDNAAWQYIFVHHGYLESWADPANAFWKTATISACADHPESPDRVIFLPFSLDLKTGDEWQMNLQKVALAIKMKWKDVKRIEFISTIRSPGNQPCPNDNDPNVVVPAYVDGAIKAVADASGGLVTVGPKIEVANCNWWVGGTDLTGAGNTGVGQLYSAYYKDHP